MSDPVRREAQVYSLQDERAARAGIQGAAARPRCGATTATGGSCRNYAVDGDRCRVHARERDAQVRPAPRRTPGLAGPGRGERRQPEGPTAPGPQPPGATAPSGASGDPDPPPSARTSARVGSFAWADAELARRGFGAAVDGLELLRDAGTTGSWTLSRDWSGSYV